MSRRIVRLLSLVYVVDYMDRSVLGAVAPGIEHSLHIGNGRLGVLASAFAVVGALVTVPAGVLVDRVRRTRLLAGATAVWSGALVIVATAQSFASLVTGRLLLGILGGVSGPTVPSLAGDAIEPSQRARRLATIDTGQLWGMGLAYVLAGVVTAFLSWRWVFVVLAGPGLLLVALLLRTSEPRRRAARPPVRDARAAALPRTGESTTAPGAPERRAAPSGPNESDRPAPSIWRVARYVLSIRTNVIIIVAISVGNFFFAGLATFAVVFAIEQYGITASSADLGLLVIGVGALLGMLAGGRLGDAFAARGHLNGRIWIASASYAITAASALPALVTRDLALAGVAITVGAAALNAATPVLDAVRLDVVPPSAWGRAESVRTILRTASEGGGPLLIGVLSGSLAGGGRAGLQTALIVTLPLLVLNAAFLLLAVRSYPRDARQAVTAPDFG